MLDIERIPYCNPDYELYYHTRQDGTNCGFSWNYLIDTIGQDCDRNKLILDTIINNINSKSMLCVTVKVDHVNLLSNQYNSVKLPDSKPVVFTTYRQLLESTINTFDIVVLCVPYHKIENINKHNLWITQKSKIMIIFDTNKHISHHNTLMLQAIN